jgi:hypothetical protein
MTGLSLPFQQCMVEMSSSEDKWSEDLLSYESLSSREGDTLHNHRRRYLHDEDDVSEETTSTASTRPFSQSQCQRETLTPKAKMTLSRTESLTRYDDVPMHLEDEEEEEENIPQLHSPSTSRELLEKLLLEDDGDEEDPTKFLLTQSMNWHEQVKMMGEEEEEEEEADRMDLVEKYSDLIDELNPPPTYHHDLQRTDCDSCLSSDIPTNMLLKSSEWDEAPDMNQDRASANQNDTFETQISYISSEEDDSNSADSDISRGKDESKYKIARNVSGAKQRSPKGASSRRRKDFENSTLEPTNALSPPPPPPPPPPRRSGSTPMAIKTQSYSLAKSQHVVKPSDPERQLPLRTETTSTSPKEDTVTTETADADDVELCLSQSQGETENGTLNENEPSILILPSGRPVLSQPSSVPLSILNPDPLDFTVASLKQQKQRDELITDPLTTPTELNIKDVEKEKLRRSFHQSTPASVLVNLSHKRYERRRLAAMEVEKVVRNLVVPNNSNTSPSEENMDRARAILLMLSEDYIKSTNEDARKGGVVALAACAIAFKKGQEKDPFVMESKDLILASVIYACQDNSSRVRYYATESLFNVIKVLPILAVHHFIILLEILRSLCADVDTDVRSGAELLDKKLKEIVISAITSGSLSPDACVPIFSRFAHIRHKPTKKMTLSWLQEFTNKLIGAPLLQFIHFFLVDIFAIMADPNLSMRQLAFQFLNTTLSKLLMTNDDFEDSGAVSVDFDKIIQSLVTTMEHPGTIRSLEYHRYRCYE